MITISADLVKIHFRLLDRNYRVFTTAWGKDPRLGDGPGHLDLFDPKPRAPAEYRGPFATIATRTPGVRFTELLPRLAARSDRFALVRSNVNFHAGHREAGSIGLTGTSQFVASGLYPP